MNDIEEYRLIKPHPIANAVRVALGGPAIRPLVLVFRKPKGVKHDRRR